MAAFELTALERKLLRLALCGSAQGAEVTTSAQKLIQSWRARGVESSAVESAINGDQDGAEVVIQSRPDYGLTTMPWGKFRGRLLADIEPSYLKWAQQWILEDEKRARKFRDLAEAIERFLDQR